MITGVQTIVYEVPDMALAKVFYSKAFQCEPYFEEVFYIGFNIKGYELGLHPDNPTSHRVQNVVAHWGVEDIHETLEHFLVCGADLNSPVQNVGGDILVASVRDPFGNVIGFIFNPDFRIS